MEADEIHARIAGRIRELCAKRGLHLIELADAAGVSRGFLFEVLAGRQSISVAYLVKIANALEADPVALLKPYKGKPPAAEDFERPPRVLRKKTRKKS